MKRQRIPASLCVVASVLLASLTIAAQDRFTLKVPDGLAFSEFKGYDAWPVVAPSYTDDGVKAILGNPVMINAYNAGIPGNGKPVPDGAMFAKIEWLKHGNPVSPYTVTVPDKLKSVSFMIKDAKRFSSTGGWGYAQFTYDSASDTFKPSVKGFGCGYTCHTRVKARDYVFTVQAGGSC